MKVFKDQQTGIVLGELPGDFAKPDAEHFYPSHETLSQLIVSHSGWRKVFAASGQEEDAGKDLNREDAAIVAIMADSFALYLLETSGSPQPKIALGMDSRPTGRAISDVMLRIFLSYGFQVDYYFICAAPEIMAVTRHGSPDGQAYSGFCYITASHNPIGHNGVKFGLGDAAVIGGARSQHLMGMFWDSAKNLAEARHTPGSENKLFKRYLAPSAEQMEACFQRSAQLKQHSLNAYKQFTNQVSTASKSEREIESRTKQIKRGLASRPLGIVIDFNGSARAASIDRDYLGGLGIKVRAVNEETGKIAHRIVPEGSSLDTCICLLETAHAEDPSFIVGYTPDNDGDRGNLVLFDETLSKARPMEAQEVFALAVAAELAWMEHLDSKLPAAQARPKNAIVVNCATSIRIEQIARAFDARLATAEVGEANVVGLAIKLRKEGFRVRILGEGSNGGNITHPSAVRDPLNTICSVVKLLAIPALGKIIATRLAGIQGSSTPNSTSNAHPSTETLAGIIATLPAFTSSSAYEDRAIMSIESTDHAQLKSEYERIFLAEWPQYREVLAPLGIRGWQELNTEGIECRSGFGAGFRSGSQRGGLKIQFKDQEGRPQAFIWMRGSGTEPVFRILADVAGKNSGLEEKLLAWQRSMIERADKTVQDSASS